MPPGSNRKGPGPGLQWDGKTKPGASTPAHRQDVPGIFRDDVDRDKINLGLGVSRPAVVVVDTQPVKPPHQASAGFHLYPPQVSSTLQHEVVAMQVSVGQRDSETQAGCFVHKSQFAQLALEGI